VKERVNTDRIHRDGVSTPRKNRIPILIAFGFLLWGCEALWNLGHQSSLKNDIDELFRAHGIVISQPNCNMIGTTRSATCRFKASPEQVGALACGLHLKELKEDETEREVLARRVPEPSLGCLICDPFDRLSRMKVYVSERRAKELRLKRGSALEYLIVFQDPQSDQVCVQFSYAYG